MRMQVPLQRKSSRAGFIHTPFPIEQHVFSLPGRKVSSFLDDGALARLRRFLGGLRNPGRLLPRLRPLCFTTLPLLPN